MRLISTTMMLCGMCLGYASAIDLLEGDLLFSAPAQGNAITAVTSGTDGLPIDHVGIVHYVGGKPDLAYVIEATGAGVVLTPVDTFLCRNASVVGGRLTVPFDVSLSMARALNYVGRPYDYYFDPGDSAIYCSELVQICYVDSQSHPVFSTIPMSFHDASGRVTDYWRQHYNKVGLEVPEGAPGTNPGEMSRRPEITILGLITTSEP